MSTEYRLICFDCQMGLVNMQCWICHDDMPRILRYTGTSTIRQQMLWLCHEYPHTGTQYRLVCFQWQMGFANKQCMISHEDMPWILWGTGESWAHIVMTDQSLHICLSHLALRQSKRYWVPVSGYSWHSRSIYWNKVEVPVHLNINHMSAKALALQQISEPCLILRQKYFDITQTVLLLIVIGRHAVPDLWLQITWHLLKRLRCTVGWMLLFHSKYVLGFRILVQLKFATDDWLKPFAASFSQFDWCHLSCNRSATGTSNVAYQFTSSYIVINNQHKRQWKPTLAISNSRYNNSNIRTLIHFNIEERKDLSLQYSVPYKLPFWLFVSVQKIMLLECLKRHTLMKRRTH